MSERGARSWTLEGCEHQGEATVFAVWCEGPPITPSETITVYESPRSEAREEVKRVAEELRAHAEIGDWPSLNALASRLDSCVAEKGEDE